MEFRNEGPSRTVANLLAGRKQHVVTYGTSLTFGGTWVPQVASMLDHFFPGLATVTNSGENGKWSTWGLEHLDERVINKWPNTVIIEFGINDAYLDYATSVEQARANVQTMIDRILAANADTEIILMTMNPPTGVHLEHRPNFAAHYQMYRQVAHTRGLMLIDHQPAWQELLENDPAEFERCVPDGLHPAPIGCQKITTPRIIAALVINPSMRRSKG